MERLYAMKEVSAVVLYADEETNLGKLNEQDAKTMIVEYMNSINCET